MTHGIDTDFLVAVEIRDHPGHRLAVALLERLLDGGHDLAVAPQILAEFIHVVTDAKRMPEPLSVPEAILRAEHWWHATEVQRRDHALLHHPGDSQTLLPRAAGVRYRGLGKEKRGTGGSPVANE